MFFSKKVNETEVEITRNEMVINQNKASKNMKCPVCGGEKFTSGYKGDYHFNVTQSSFFKDKDCIFPTTFKMCESCGHIEMFAMFNYIAASDFKPKEVKKEHN